MTPAETLAATKQRKRPKRNPPSLKMPRKIVWVTTVRDARERLNLSMRDVARSLGMSLSGYWCIELGADVNLTNAVKISEFFELSVASLWPARKEPS